MKIVKQVIIHLLYHLNLYKTIQWIRNLRNGHTVTILVYHSFTDKKNSHTSLHVDTFVKQLVYLKENFRVRRLGDVIKKIKNKEALEKNTLCITIDDGYLDNYKFAYPALKKMSLDATIFIASGYVGRNTRDLIDDEHTADNEPDPHTAYSNQDIYRLPPLKKQMMTWEQIKEISNDIIEIGSHTVNHPILSKVPIDEARAEIIQSKQEIEDALNKPVDLFAYPNGLRSDYNAAICDLVEDAGYDAAVTVDWALNNAAPDLYRLRRIPISEMRLPQFAAKINRIVSDP